MQDTNVVANGDFSFRFDLWKGLKYLKWKKTESNISKYSVEPFQINAMCQNLGTHRTPIIVSDYGDGIKYELNHPFQKTFQLLYQDPKILFFSFNAMFTDTLISNVYWYFHPRCLLSSQMHSCDIFWDLIQERRSWILENKTKTT